jgi:hypothetical protein
MEVVPAYFKLLSQHFVEGLGKTMKPFDQDSRPLHWESNPGPSENEEYFVTKMEMALQKVV